MSFEITLNIPDGSLAEYQIESMAESEHISREEAAFKLIEATARPRRGPASPEARRILGAFSSPEDRAVMDDVMELIRSDRDRQNAESLHD